MWMRSGKRLVRRIITNDGCGDDGGKGGKGGGNGRLGVRRMRWKIERRRREKKDMLIVISLTSARQCRLWRSSQFSSYIYLYICIHLVYMHSAGGGDWGEERDQTHAIYVLHVIQNRNLAVDNEVKTPDQVVEKSDRFEDS